MKQYLMLLLLAGTFLWSGCGSSNNFNDISGQQGGNINIPIGPVARDDAYTTNANTQLVVNAANGVLANDSQLNSTITYPAATTQNGTLVGAQDGSFVYTPVNNFTGTDTFVYTLTNNFGSSSATVTITVAAVNGFFVDAATGNDGTGSFNNGLPFASIQAAANAAPDNATIVVRPGNYTGAITLKNGQRLLGSGSTLVNAQGVNRPVLTGPVVLADGNTLDFLRIAGTAGNAVDADGQNGGTVTNCEFANTTAGGNGGSGVRGNDTRGTWTVSNNSFNSLAGGGIGFQTIGSNLATYIVRNNTMTGNGLLAVGFSSEGTSNVKAQVHGNTFTGNNTVTGDALEIECVGDSTFGLDLEDNNNTGGVFSLFVNPFGDAEMRVEQLNELTLAKPNGAGNTGTVNDNTGIGGKPPIPVADGFFTF